MATLSTKAQTTRLLKKLRASGNALAPAWRSKHNTWLAKELSLMASELSLGGEGVEQSGQPQNTNQSQPTGNFLQCAPKADSCLPKVSGTNPIAGVAYYTGIVDDPYIPDYRGIGEGRDSKPIVASLTTGEGQESSKVEIEALEAVKRHNETIGDGSYENEHVVEAPGAKEGRYEGVTDYPGQLGQIPLPKWPTEAKVKVTGYCPNPRLMVGQVVDEGGRLGKVVSLWRGRLHFRVGAVVTCRLDEVRGEDARYLPV